ncbi:MAG: D-alanyl-D-alanine carboxypeptidase/D-alanyl-D-alanine-endopeptidase [Phycisphaerales bacterium]|jgi:D-alanyl-D-alanine carboxypeptidase/D-alanyl-D-alanine-endopeptidase (penicillin-binding protein 4)|nr:D-alanyl-D-alanine carboxypeptidase/D-alanyl-D-alanine-endopeptidase [Phycisphaerales bacterium]
MSHPPALPRTIRALCTLALVVASSALALAGDLQREVEALVAQSGLSKARIGVSVLDLSTGRALAEVDADQSLTPASNMKLLTSGAALLVLGEDFAFRTEFAIDERGAGRRVIVRGSGDPGLGDTELLSRGENPMSVEQMLGAIAKAFRTHGLEHATEIVVDDRIFDREYVHPTWPEDQLNRWYCAQVTGANFFTNCVDVYPAPSSRPDTPALVTIEPEAPWMEIDTSRSRTVTTGQNTVWVSRVLGTNRLALNNNVRNRPPEPIPVAIHEPNRFLGRLIAKGLVDERVAIGPAQDNISLEAALSAVRLAEPDEVLAGGTLVAVVRTSMQDVLSRCNTDSQNLYAECLLKRLGRESTGQPGSWTNGASVLRMLVAERLGSEFAQTLVVADGSGMSRENRVTPRLITAWLAMMRRADVGDTFVGSLATPGVGTLRKRFSEQRPESNVHAKSGYLFGVVCLSGYVVHPTSGRTVAFSVLLNDVPRGEQVARAQLMQEQVVIAIDRWLLANEPAQATAPASGG